MAGAGPGREETPRWEWAAALTLTAAVVALAAFRMLHAGGLWRDEAGSAQLAAMPSLREALALYQYESFPPPFVIAVRAFCGVFGGGDRALRAFGLAVALGVVAVLWLNARTTARRVPLLSLALIGLDVPFLVLGESLRGYGLGTALILLTYGLLARGLDEDLDRRPRAARLGLVALTAAAAVASVQVLLGNAALLLALCSAAMAVAAARRRWFFAAGAAASGLLAALSLLPYAAQLAAARQGWTRVIIHRIRIAQIGKVFAATLGGGAAWMVWAVLVAVALWCGGVELRRRRSPAVAPATSGSTAESSEPRFPDAAVFAGLTIPAALIATLVFLESLSYIPRPWYLLPASALVACALDTLWSTLAGRGGRPLATLRAAAVVVVAVLAVPPLWQRLGARQTNADLVARQVAGAAAPQDLVVVTPWYYGVSFNRYYLGAAPWVTLPEIPDHRIHRYDQLMARLAARQPIDDLLAAVTATLRAGHRVWLVGDVGGEGEGSAEGGSGGGGGASSAAADREAALPPAPDSPAGWQDFPYLAAWTRQLRAFLRVHGSLVTPVRVAAGAPVNDLEKMPLAMAQGWRR